MLKKTFRKVCSATALSFALLFNSVSFAENNSDKTPIDYAMNGTMNNISAYNVDKNTDYDLTGLWKIGIFNIVVRVDKCDDKLCPVIYWIAPKETGIYSWIGPYNQPNNVTRADIETLCGTNMASNMKPSGRDKWSGVIYASAVDMTYDLTLEIKNKNKIDMHASWGWLFKNDTWTRIPKSQEKYYPSCISKLKTPPPLK